MEYDDIIRYGEIQYLKGRLDELYKGYVPRSTSRDNRIVDSRISKYEEKLKNTDEVAFHLYQTEIRNRVYSKNRSKKEIKKLLEDTLDYISDSTIKERIVNQIDKY